MRIVNLGLGEKVRLFNGVAIEIASKCNRTCYFCPNAYNSRQDVFMSEETVDKLLGELALLNYRGRIEWYIYNEPTRDNRLAKFIRWARLRVPRACQMINTNGDYFKSDTDIGWLFECGLNQMQINVYSADDASESSSLFNQGVVYARIRAVKLQSWVDRISPLYGIDQMESLYLNIGPNKRACKVVAKFGIQKSVKDSQVEGPNYFCNRSGNVPEFRDGLVEPLKKMCVRPFRFLNINYAGEALLCCNDYHGVVKIGNVVDHTLVELWNSEILNKYRIKLLGKNREATLCDVCDFSGGYYQHEVDRVTTGSPKRDQKIVSSPLRVV